MKNFDWDGFKATKFRVGCDTKEKAEAFMAECEEHGLAWRHGPFTPTQSSNWENEREKTLYTHGMFVVPGLGYCSREGSSCVEYPLPIVEYVLEGEEN